MSDPEKYDIICNRMQSTFPVLAGVWQKAHARFGDRWLAEFIQNVEAIYGTVTESNVAGLDDAMNGYAEFANDSMRSQAFFEKHRRYKNSNYAQAVTDFYHNEEYMTRSYLPGQYLSHYLWPQHFFMLHGFRNVVLPRAQVGLFFEVGVGCGMYSRATLQSDARWRGMGFDISPHSLHFTKNMLDTFGLGDRYQIHNRDISLGFDQKCDFLICQEVLEHLENPAEFVRWLHAMIRPGGSAYITAALNAAHSDHIYLFRDPLELEVMLREAGFLPTHGQEEFAPGSKPREITPSLAGYYCERP